MNTVPAQWRMPENSEPQTRMKLTDNPAERRHSRRHDLQEQALTIERSDAKHGKHLALGQIVDISTGGIRVRAPRLAVQPDQQIRVRLELPSFAGICPFIDTSSGQPAPKQEWVGWMNVSRVINLGDDHCEIAGRLLDMEEMDRGMFGLYLSTQPLAA